MERPAVVVLVAEGAATHTAAGLQVRDGEGDVWACGGVQVRARCTGDLTCC
jgi:hypothetical protein